MPSLSAGAQKRQGGVASALQPVAVPVGNYLLEREAAPSLPGAVAPLRLVAGSQWCAKGA